ncbi:hypothetical protein K450DRAFT_176997 [Umbelopsis ramanniana AG]|uniref:glucan 1,3-beta-glucosidase n=1 Tax=Umbelopsis ramanniana AG TaxID=1314678 RepID=A0AAD5E7W3_UMBRA|nr:uncharacterized protein K450DRAFT_176997 [Umbelopsis ramanniana AG]KAI8577940.1 hypothetical protein K450DRAFT_176997 [Umbelopsis ramanniana AG]
MPLTNLLLILLSFQSLCSAAVIKREGTAWNYWRDKAFGANVGNWLVLERWIAPQLFEQHAPNANDEWTFCQQATNASEILKEHWRTWITEDDFRTLASVGANHIRIPVGYWAFIAPIDGEPYVTEGQKPELERILSYCGKYNINALIVLHGLPGSQNGEQHSGHAGAIEFYQRDHYSRSLTAVQAAVDWMNSLPYDLKSRISGIEPVNEPQVRDDREFRLLSYYYRKSYDIIHQSAYQVPMIFSDGWRPIDQWRLNAWSGFLPAPANAVIDLHPYWAFPPSTDSSTIISQICAMGSPDSGFHLPVMIGEWSLASGVSSSDTWLRQFMDTQVSVWKQSAGGTFWALKNNINSDVWSFEQLISEGYINSGTFSAHTNAQC